MKSIKKILIVAVALLIISSVVESAEIKFYGYSWMRYTASETNKKWFGDLKESSFSIPRTYLRWKIKSSELAGNITVDINNVKGGQEIESGKGKIDWAIWIKYCYVDLLEIIPYDGAIRFGMQKTYFGTIDTWEYPLIEKALEDKQKLLSSADLGFGITGYLPDGWGDYALAVYNGSGYKKMENNLNKAIAGSISLIPISGVSLRLSQYISSTNKIGVKKYYATERTAAVLSLSFYPLNSFIEYLTSVDTGKRGLGYSAFLSWTIINQKLEMLLRNDGWNSDISKNKESYDYTYIIGLNYYYTDDLLLQINYQHENYYKSKKADSKQYLVQLKWSF